MLQKAGGGNNFFQRQCCGRVSRSPTERSHPWRWFAQHRPAGASRVSSRRCRDFCLQMLQLPLFLLIPEEYMYMFVFWCLACISFPLGSVPWFPCSPRQQCWRKAIQMSSPSPLSLSGSQVKVDPFMTVLIFSVTFYWAPVISWERELASLLFLVWSDKLAPLPWDNGQKSILI